MNERRLLGRSGFLGGWGRLARSGRRTGGDGQIHATVNFTAGHTGPGARGAVTKRGEVGGDFIHRKLEEICVGAKETAHIDLGQIEVVLVALEFEQIIAANFGGFRGFAQGNAFAFARFFEAFANGLHVE